MKSAWYALTLGFLASVSACGGDDDPAEPAACDLSAQTGCAEGQVCEEVEDDDGTQTGCFAPLFVEGRVVRADATEEGIEGARVVGRDENGVPVSAGIAISGAEGQYSLRVPAKR